MNNDNSALAHHIEIDSVHCTIVKNGQSTKIDPIITRLIVYFAKHPDVVISRTELAEKVWKSSFASDDAINRSISTLRRALSSQREAFIKTVPKKGYCFSVPENTQVELIVEPEEKMPLAQSVENEPKSYQEDINDTPNKDIVEVDEVIAAKTSAPITAPITVPKARQYKPVWFVLCMLVVVGGFYWWPSANADLADSNDNDSTFVSTGVKQSVVGKITLGAGQWQSNSDRLSDEFVGQLQRLMLSDLSREERFIVDYQSGQFKTKVNGYYFDVTLKVFDNNAVANLSLVDSNEAFVREIFTVTEPLENSEGPFDAIKVMQALSNQMSAAIRVALLHPSLFKRYRGAIEQYTYTDLEQLIHARSNLYNYNPGAQDNGKKVLASLKQKYPNSSYAYGIEALTYVFIMDVYRNRWASVYQPMFELTQKTLQLDPTNVDALIALFHYYYHYAGTRHKVDTVVEDLLRYHPNDQQAWRTKLFLMIKSTQPCEDIRALINEIPAGVFKPLRIQTIKRILATCLDGADVNQLLTIHSDSSKAKRAERRAIMNNLYLFEIRHDNLAEIYSLKYNNKTKGRYLAEHYAASIQMGDELRTQALTYEIQKISNDFDLWLANLYAALYQRKSFSEYDVFVVEDYRYIERFSDLNLVVALIQDMQQRNDKTKLQNYIQKRPVFDVNMINRYESMARMMVLYANGDIEQSRRIAVKLYNLFETYRIANQNSYYFYNIGRFQLLTAFYCGISCIDMDTVDVDAQLSLWFADNHIWWFDDQQLTKIALSFWSEHPLVNAYLERIEQDKLELKDTLGF